MSIRPRGLQHGYLVNEDSGDVLQFQYNPSSYYTEHGALWEEIESPGSSYRKVSYGGRSVERFPLTLDFYGVKNVSSGKSSTQIENYIENLTIPRHRQSIIKGTNHFISPPICTIVFNGRCRRVVVSKAKITRTLFNPSLQTMCFTADLEVIVIK